jgi:PAS domain S-box-containing protein
MHQQTTDPAVEIKRLQRCMNDLVSVLALPAVWSVSEPSRIVETFLDALLAMLDLDFLYARVRLDVHKDSIETLKTARIYEESSIREEIYEDLNQLFGEDPQRWPAEVLRHLGKREVSVFPIRMGVEGELGLIVAGSQAADFPEQTESLVLSVAANQAALGLQQALRLIEQKRVASELDRRVAERTRELAETNTELQLQVGLLQHLPVSAWTLKPDGTPDFVNQIWLEFSGQTLDFVRSHPEAWMTAIHPEDREKALRSFWNGVRSEQAFAFETRTLRAKDGTYRWHLQQAVVLRDAEGKVLRFVGTTTDIDDSKRAEDKLRRSEARYRVVVETASDAVVSIDEGGAIVLANPATKQIFGYDPEELVGKPLTVLMPGATRKLHETGFKQYLETGTKHLNWRGTEMTALRANGEEFPVEVSFGEMTADQQRIFTGFIRDISAKKRSEEAILASERNLSLIINTMPVLAWSALPDGTGEFFNQRWLDYTGMSPEQAGGWGWAEAVHRDDLGRMTEYWQSIIATGASGEIEARFRRFDGEYRWFLFRADPMRDESGTIVKWYGTNTDIDDRKRAEEGLRLRELNLRQITETIPEMLWSAAPDGAIDYCNGRLLDYTGFRPDEVMKDGWMSLLHPDDLEPTVKIWKTCVESGAPYRAEVRLIHSADHAYRWCVASALPLLDQEGRVVKWHGTVVDMHDWKQSQEELRNTQAELARMMRVMTIGQLTASIAHEVSQPLSGIITNASTCLRMLSSDPPNVDGARETAHRTIRDGNRATDVITRLRTLFSKKQINVEPLDLNEAAREVIVLLSSELHKNRVILQHQFGAHLPAVMGDRVQLQQVILNLIRNASDAMGIVNDRPRQLTIRTELDGEGVRVSVQDSGVGFDPEVIDRLFQSFFTTKQEGMGIGLSLSRSIVEAHRGRMWATRNDGPGATFAFSIPCDQAPQPDGGL